VATVATGKRVAMSNNDDAALIQNEHPVRGDA
jgi:hypothetical protein